MEVRDRAVPLGWFAFVAVVALVLFFMVVGLVSRVDALRAEYSSLYSQYVSLDMEYAALQEHCEAVEGEYNKLVMEYSRLYSQYLDLNRAYQRLLSDYQSEVHDVFQWLYGASEMSPGEFSQQVHGCLFGEVLDYPCVLFRRDFQYTPDIGDRASAYPEFISRGGGDCEDFAFYAFALINSASRAGYRLRFYRRREGSRYLLPDRYYIPDADAFEVVPYRAYVVCGYKSSGDDYQHCVVQVCDLVDCYYVEPQTGEVLEAPFSEITLVVSPRDIVWYGKSLRQLALRWGVFP